MINVMIADDQELIRKSLKIVLDQNEDMQVTALAENGRQLMDILATQQPEIILMDVRMPELDGVQATREVKLHYPEVKIIILTTFDDDEYVFNALKYGASGYLLKGVSVPDLTAAIRTVVSGGAMINPGIVTKVVKFFNQMARQEIPVEVDESGVDELSKTERNIAHLVGRDAPTGKSRRNSDCLRGQCAMVCPVHYPNCSSGTVPSLLFGLSRRAWQRRWLNHEALAVLEDLA